MGKAFAQLKGTKAFSMIETIIAVALFAGAALVIFSFLTSTRIVASRETNLMNTQNLAATVGQDIVGRSAGGAIISDARTCSVGGPVQPTNPDGSNKTSLQDPFCCNTGGDPYCTALRRAQLCGTYDAASQYETQAMRTSATWARNLYSKCKIDLATCSIPGVSGTNICTGDGLIFNTPAEFTSFFALLPDPINFAQLQGKPPKEIRLKIEPVTLTDIDTPIAGSCGGAAVEPVWTIDHMMKVTFMVIVAGEGMDAQDNRDTTAVYSVHLGWPRDAALNITTYNPLSPANLGNEVKFHAGPNDLVSAIQGNPPAINETDNLDNGPTTPQFILNVYNKDGTIRVADTMCSGGISAAWLAGGGTSQEPGYTYLGWEKYLYGARASFGGMTPYCRAPSAVPAMSAADLNVCCEDITVSNPVATIADETVAGSGTTYRVGFNTAFTEGQILPIGQMDSMGNKTLSHNIMFTPGYCPLTSLYCADGDRTGLEVDFQPAANYTAAGPGNPLCPPEGTWGPPPGGAYIPAIGNPRGDIYCHPHDGCWALCPMGTRTGQNCPAAQTYCSVDNDGVGMGTDIGNLADPSVSVGPPQGTPRGCGTGIDCIIDLRCGDSVCDDCGHENCVDSTILVANLVAPITRTSIVTPAPFPVVSPGPWMTGADYTPYADTTSFPTIYVGIPLGVGGCPDAASYCPVGARLGASVTGALGTQYHLPQDNCGNSCPDGTRRYITCPADRTSYCSLDPVAPANQDVVRTGTYPGPRSPRCTGPQCSAPAPNNTPVDDCNQYCLPSLYAAQTIGCPAPNTYCPTTSPNPAIPNPLTGGSGVNWLPHDFCGNDCPEGNLPAPDGTAHDGCLDQSAYCFDPTGGSGPSNCVGAIQPGSEPVDVCGRICGMTTCVCPDPATVCAGQVYNSTTSVCSTFACSVVGTMPWTTQSDALWCDDGNDNTGANDTAGHPYMVAWCDDPYTGHHHTEDLVGTKPSNCPTQVPLFCFGQTVIDNCLDICPGGGTMPFPNCNNSSYCAPPQTVPDVVCNDPIAGPITQTCGPGTIAWSGCAGAPGNAPTVICGDPVNNTCTDITGNLSNYCGYTGTGYNAAQCNANKATTGCGVQAVDNCGNPGCGFGSSGSCYPPCSLVTTNACWSAGNEFRIGPLPGFGWQDPPGIVVPSWPCSVQTGTSCNPSTGAVNGSCAGSCQCVFCQAGH